MNRFYFRFVLEMFKTPWVVSQFDLGCAYAEMQLTAPLGIIPFTTC
jgi:hypothetical protein